MREAKLISIVLVRCTRAIVMSLAYLSGDLRGLKDDEPTMRAYSSLLDDEKVNYLDVRELAERL